MPSLTDVCQVNHNVNHAAKQTEAIQAVSNPRTAAPMSRSGGAAAPASYHVSSSSSSSSSDYKQALHGAAPIQPTGTEPSEKHQVSQTGIRQRLTSGNASSNIAPGLHPDPNSTKSEIWVSPS